MILLITGISTVIAQCSVYLHEATHDPTMRTTLRKHTPSRNITAWNTDRSFPL